MNFGSKAKYARWIAYAKIHGKPGKHPKKITIKGKKHKVVHRKKK